LVNEVQLAVDQTIQNTDALGSAALLDMMSQSDDDMYEQIDWEANDS